MSQWYVWGRGSRGRTVRFRETAAAGGGHRGGHAREREIAAVGVEEGGAALFSIDELSKIAMERAATAREAARCARHRGGVFRRRLCGQADDLLMSALERSG